MAWVVDTCLLIDVAEADPTFGVASAKLLDLKRADGFTICPVTSSTWKPTRATLEASARRGCESNSESFRSCFFDDPVHKLMGLPDEAFQSLYHFTVGGPREDARLVTRAAYHHLEAPAQLEAVG